MVTAPALRIVYFGTPEFAVPTLRHLIASRHPVVAVVSQPDRPSGRGHRVHLTPTHVVAREHGVPVLQPERLRSDEFLAAVQSLAPDLGVVAAYGKILPDALLAIPKFGMINVHGSLLPAYRGAAPVHRAVMAGDAETGVTIMRVVKALDAGPMLATARRAIGPEETSTEVERALAELGAPLLVDVVERIAAGRAVEQPQDEALATYAPKLSKEEGSIEWSIPARRIHDCVRGLQPWPLVSARLDGHRYLIHRTALTHERTSEPGGTVVDVTKDDLSVAGGDGGVLHILEIQPEGRRVMRAREFLAGRRLARGQRFERA